MNISKVRGFSLRELLWLLAFFFLMEPRYFYYVSGIKTVFRYMILFLAAFLVILYFAQKYKKSKIVLLVCVYHLYLVLITVYRKGDISTALFDSAVFIGLCILTDIIMQRKPEFLYTKLLYLLEIEVTINLFVILLFPEGLYNTDYFKRNFFLGYDNQMVNIFIPAVLMAFLYKQTKRNAARIHFYYISIVTIASIIIVWSGASLIIIAMIYGLLLFKLADNTKILNMRNYLIVNVVMFFLLVIFNQQERFQYLIVNLLHKNLTLTGRTYIWERAIYFIRKRIVFGYGVESQTYRAYKMALRLHYHVSQRVALASGLHAHDRFLETLYRGGFILSLIYGAILVFLTVSLMKYRELVSSKILAVVLFAYLTGMLTEFYRLSYMFFPMMVMAENVTYLENSVMKKAERPRVVFKLKRLNV